MATQMTEGDVWFAVSRKWWLAWRRHTGCEEWSESAVGPDAGRGNPGPINNEELVLEASAPGSMPGFGRRLKLRLVRGFHFEMVPQEAWRALVAWCV
ncbi:unnamed protein product [Discosporangium mesarthrocarpum]